jgi:hypothetical protein
MPHGAMSTKEPWTQRIGHPHGQVAIPSRAESESVLRARSRPKLIKVRECGLRHNVVAIEKALTGKSPKVTKRADKSRPNNPMKMG